MSLLLPSSTAVFDQHSGSNTQICSRLIQRMIIPAAVSPAPTGEAQLPNQFIGHFGPSSFSELTERCYHVVHAAWGPFALS